MTYQIKLPQFEGPFDLLLFFIERDELEVHDIPIAEMTSEFLDYIQQMKTLNIELASEFILVAATLMRIKAKMLLPRPEVNEAGEVIDPRQELVDKLLEYKKYKEVVLSLQDLEEERLKRYKRGNTLAEQKRIAAQFQTEYDLESINLYKLLHVFQRVVNRFDERQQKFQLSIIKHPFTIKSEKESIRQLIHQQTEVPCNQLFASCTNRLQAIFRFLAMLEAIQERWLNIRIGLGMNNFWVTRFSN